MFRVLTLLFIFIVFVTSGLFVNSPLPMQKTDIKGHVISTSTTCYAVQAHDETSESQALNWYETVCDEFQIVSSVIEIFVPENIQIHGESFSTVILSNFVSRLKRPPKINS